MQILEKKGHLTNELIEEWSKEAGDVYSKAAVQDSKTALKVQLSIEEMLLRFRDRYGTEEECELKASKTRKNVKFTITQKGLQRNPIVAGDEPYYELLTHLDLNPSYSYNIRQSVNCVTFSYGIGKKKKPMIVQLMIAVVLAIVTSIVLDRIGANAVAPVLDVLFKKITTLFSAIATPLVFCAVISGICGIGDAATFGRIGFRLLKRMIVTYLIAMFFLVIVGLPMGLAALGPATGGKDVYLQLLELVLDMIPKNIMEPFTTDNDLQVIVLAMFIGVTMLIMGNKASRVKLFIAEVGDIVNQMMLIVCKLLPIFVYLGICALFLGGKLAHVGQVSKILLVSFIACALDIAVVIIRTRIVTGKPLMDIIKPQLPALMINLTTSSQISALPESMKCCKVGYHIDEKLVDFGLPLGIVVYMPNGAIMLGAITWVLGTMTNGPADPVTVLKVAFVAMVVAIAAPPIPGSAFAVMPILFSACGTDLAMMPLAVIVASTFGYLLPAMNGFCLQEELLMVAKKSDMIEKW